MDFDLIDAAGTAAIFKDGGKSATVTLSTGARYPLTVFIDPVIAEPDGFEDLVEQRWLVNIMHCSATPAVGAKVRTPDGTIYTLVQRIYDDAVVEQWSARKYG